VTGAERICEVLDGPVERYGDAEASRLERAEGRVTFRRVTFGYERRTPVLHELDVDVAPGEVIGIVGRSGSGKTTAMQLLLGFYEPNEGAIELDGRDIRTLRLEDLRQQIGLVPQEAFLFSGTIAENIAYARPEATLEQIVAAARVAAAHEFIVRQPEGYDTQVGERGQRLSGGERQRVAIARALLRDPVILILDEATASVDVDTERRIQEGLRRRSRTTFVITHRLTALQIVDRVILLDQGRAVASGPWSALGAEWAAASSSGLAPHVIPPAHRDR
jgi:ATP-binding cassette subfamily B protein